MNRRIRTTLIKVRRVWEHLLTVVDEWANCQGVWKGVNILRYERPDGWEFEGAQSGHMRNERFYDTSRPRPIRSFSRNCNGV